MKIGYCRVSTKDQNLDLQIDALKKAGCEKIFSDKLSGAIDKRPGLEEAIRFARRTDMIVVYKLDRLSRSLSSLLKLVNELHEKGVEFQSLTEQISFSGPTGKFYFHLISALSQLERDIIKSRCKAGIEAARARGRFGGRRPVLDEKQSKNVIKMYAAGVSVKDISKQLRISETTIYRRVNKEKA